MRKELTPRKRQALEMRSKIQNTALDLFNREGFENVSVEQIAQTAGCSVGNIYHYFKSKDELAIQVTSHVDQTYLELEEQYLSDRNTPARDKLLDFVGQSLVSSVSEPVLYKAFIHAIKYPEQHILQKNDRRVYYLVLAHPSSDLGARVCSSWSCASTRAASTRRTPWTKSSRISSFSTAERSSNGGSTRGISTSSRAAAAWPPSCSTD